MHSYDGIFIYMFMFIYSYFFEVCIYITRVYGNDHFGHNKSLKLIIFHLLRER